MDEINKILKNNNIKLHANSNEKVYHFQLECYIIIKNMFKSLDIDG